jgi:hypothetical protein
MKRVGFIDLKRTPENEEDPSFLRGLNIICSGEMLNYKLNARRGFHPRRSGSPYAITPEKVIHLHRSVQGRQGRTGLSPLRLSCPFYFIPPKESPLS